MEFFFFFFFPLSFFEESVKELVKYFGDNCNTIKKNIDEILSIRLNIKNYYG